jgi:glucans biosynthesis protein
MTPAMTITAHLRRWRFVCLLLTLFGVGLAPAAAFDLDDVDRLAAALAGAPYRPAPPDDAPAARPAALSYDAYRQLRFRPDQSLWRGQASFEVQFFPLGRSFTRPLRLYEIVEGQASPIVVRRSAFDAPDAPSPAPGDAPVGVAGWRLTYPLHSADKRDEVIALLGASYFRALGKQQRYGASARGLAVDTAAARGEEFPAFIAFWLERPAVHAKSMTFYALLDGPSASGAYRFEVRPGQTTTVDVQARLHLRDRSATLGIAPLTSMFLAGENQPRADDFRPEVHDSDGLQIAMADGEWLWRPLTNPRSPFVTSFAASSPRGFGLSQRDRNFSNYEDLEAHYDRRPSVWVEPVGEWGAGRVELLQFHTPDETHDNVVAYWVPARVPEPGAPFAMAWRLHWSGDDTITAPGARVVQTRRGHGYREAPIDADRMQFHLDFVGPGLPAAEADVPAEDLGIEAVASGDDNVRGLRAIAYPNAVRGGWRVTLDFERMDARRPVELRVFLRRGEHTVSETWSYALAPE